MTSKFTSFCLSALKRAATYDEALKYLRDIQHIADYAIKDGNQKLCGSLFSIVKHSDRQIKRALKSVTADGDDFGEDIVRQMNQMRDDLDSHAKFGMSAIEAIACGMSGSEKVRTAAASIHVWINTAWDEVESRNVSACKSFLDSYEAERPTLDTDLAVMQAACPQAYDTLREELSYVEDNLRSMAFHGKTSAELAAECEADSYVPFGVDAAEANMDAAFFHQPHMLERDLEQSIAAKSGDAGRGAAASKPARPKL